MKVCPQCYSCFEDDFNWCTKDRQPLIFSMTGTTLLDGRYQLEKKLGQGGMGMVFKARHVFLKTQHAIKAILPDLVGNNPQLGTRFRHEAILAASIHHPNVISVTDFGMAQGIIPFLVMEFLDGESLSKIMQQRHHLPIDQVIKFIEPICSGVSAAHRLNIIHRDIKPLNIMIQYNKPLVEAVKVLDFGLAKIKSTDASISMVQAQSTNFMGSPAYMAPEQWMEDEPTNRTDIYSIGIIAYQMLTGLLPFQGNSLPMIMRAHLQDTPPSFAALGLPISPLVESVVKRALEKDPQRRHNTIEEFCGELRNAITTSGKLFDFSHSPTGDNTLVLTGNVAPQQTQPLSSLENQAIASPEYLPHELNDARRRLEEESQRRLSEAEARKRAEEEAKRLALEVEEVKRRTEEARRYSEEQAFKQSDESELHRSAKETIKLLEEETARRMAEEEARRVAEEEARRITRELEDAKKQAQEEERKRTDRQAFLEESRRRAVEEAQRIAREIEEAQRHAQEEERKRKEEEARKLKEEEERKRQEEELRLRAEEEERKRIEEAARLHAEEEARKLKEEEERKRKEEEARRLAEEEKKRKEEELRLIAEEAERKQKEEARLLAEAEAKRLAEEERKRKEEEEEARKLKEAEEQKRKEEERQLAEEAERKRKEEEARQLAEEEARKRKEEKARKRKEEELRLDEEERKRKEEEARQLAEEEARKRKEEERKRAEQQALIEESRQRAIEEAERVAREIEEARKQAQEEARLRAEEEKKRKEESRRLAEEERKRVEEEAYKRAEEERKREEARWLEEARWREEQERKHDVKEQKSERESSNLSTMSSNLDDTLSSIAIPEEPKEIPQTIPFNQVQPPPGLSQGTPQTMPFNQIQPPLNLLPESPQTLPFNQIQPPPEFVPDINQTTAQKLNKDFSTTIPSREDTDPSISEPANLLAKPSVFGIALPQEHRIPLMVIGSILLFSILVIMGIGFIAVYRLTQSENPVVKKDENPPKNPGDKKDKTTPPKPPNNPNLVEIPGGDFMMGKDDIDENDKFEVPQYPAHKESVNSFLIDKTEVTNEEYAKFIAETSHKPPPDWNPGGKEKYPVVNVSIEDANAFAKWRSERDHLQCRLPTEIEWEYAARSGANNYIYPWGNDWKEGAENGSLKEPLKPVGSYPNDTTAVGELQDMMGNAFEWTSSKGSYYQNNTIAVRNKLTADTNQNVFRSSGLNSDLKYKSSFLTLRAWLPPTTRNELLGFRLVCEK